MPYNPAMNAIRRKLVLALLSLTCCMPTMAATNLLDVPDSFVADDGRTVSLPRWKGRQVILTMEYSNCRFLCSITLKKLRDIQEEADRRKLALDFVIVSLDPANDTPASWQAYRRTRDLHRPNWHFLTGSRATTDRIVGLLGVKWWYYDEHIMHDFKIVRLAPGGETAAVMQAFDMTAAELLDAR
jgi:protein SCO1/2